MEGNFKLNFLGCGFNVVVALFFFFLVVLLNSFTFLGCTPKIKIRSTPLPTLFPGIALSANCQYVSHVFMELLILHYDVVYFLIQIDILSAVLSNFHT